MSALHVQSSEPSPHQSPRCTIILCLGGRYFSLCLLPLLIFQTPAPRPAPPDRFLHIKVLSLSSLLSDHHRPFSLMSSSCGWRDEVNEVASISQHRCCSCGLGWARPRKLTDLCGSCNYWITQNNVLDFKYLIKNSCSLLFLAVCPLSFFCVHLFKKFKVAPLCGIIHAASNYPN